MDHYHVYVDLKDTHRDMEFAAAVDAYLGHLKAKGYLRDFWLTRRKLGLGSAPLPEFHITMVVDDMAQLERTFQYIAARSDPVESLHRAVYGRVQNFHSVLERTFPDAVRERPAGEKSKQRDAP